MFASLSKLLIQIVMDAEAFNDFILNIKKGYKPCTAGCFFTLEQVEVIKSAFEIRKSAMDDYFKFCIEARLRK
jgi:hypothetical protein